MFSFRIFTSSLRKQVWQLYPVIFCSESKHGENLKRVSFSLVFPQNVPLEMMNANLTTLPLSFEFAIKFYISVETTKKLWYSTKRSVFQHCFTGHVKAVWPSCQKFSAQIQKQVPFVKVFKKLFFFNKFLWTSKSHFWQACRNHFCQKLY